MEPWGGALQIEKRKTSRKHPWWVVCGFPPSRQGGQGKGVMWGVDKKGALAFRGGEKARGLCLIPKKG